MLRCIAIDDEDLARELIEDYITKVNFLQLVATLDNPVDAIKIIEEQEIDLVFLDIQMPELSGLQLIQSLSKKPMFILVTAYEKYALEGYNLDVVDYLVKPVPFDRFLKACNKAREIFQLKKGAQQPKEGDAANYFFVYADYSHIKLFYDDIIWVEGLKDYLKIYLTSSSKPIVARLSMKGLEEQLPSTKFIRIQKSYIVSKNAITAVKKNSLFIGTNELPIGENYKEGIMALIGKQFE